MSDTEKRYDIAGTGSMVVDAIHMTPRVIGSDQKILLRTGEDGQVVRRLSSKAPPGQVDEDPHPTKRCRTNGSRSAMRSAMAGCAHTARAAVEQQ